MTLIIQLSDLHFGSEDPATAASLQAEVNREQPDLVIFSGDLTMAARHGEFEAARGFADGIEADVIAVPGNHDITPYALHERFLAPYRRWRQHVGDDLEPTWFARDVAVVGINTARRMRLQLDWSHGSISRAQIRALGRRLGDAPGFRIVVAHHPFIAEETEDLGSRPRQMVKRAERALEAMAREGVDLVVAGHLHRTYAAAFAHRPLAGAKVTAGGRSGREVTVIQAGTALSSRTREEPNSFNRIEIDGDRLTVHAVTASDSGWHRSQAPLVTLTRPAHAT